MSKIRIRAKVIDGIVIVKSLIKHQMETGRRRDKDTGQLIPPHYITEVNISHGSNNILKANWGPGVSKNPYFEFKFRGGKSGDKISLSYVDNKGETGKAEAVIN